VISYVNFYKKLFDGIYMTINLQRKNVTKLFIFLVKIQAKLM